MPQNIQPGDRRPALKAGARNSAADLALIQQIADLAATLGAAANVTDPAATDAGAPQIDVTAHVALIQSTSVTAYYEAVRDAVYDLPAMPTGDGDFDYPYCTFVYLGYCIINFGKQYFRTTFNIVDGKIKLAPWMDWIEVKHEWVVKALTSARQMAAKSAEANVSAPDRIGGYALIYGTAIKTDLYTEYFSRDTAFWLGEWKTRPMMYHHRLQNNDVLRVPIGVIDTIEQDEAGIYVEGTLKSADEIAAFINGELEKAKEYRDAIHQLVQKGVLHWSTDSAPHLVDRVPQSNKSVWLKTWPFYGASLTPTPAEPRLPPVAEIKSAYQTLGLPIPQSLNQSLSETQSSSAKATPADGTQGAASETAQSNASNAQGGKTAMKTFAEILEAAEQAALDGKVDEAKALQDRAATLKSIQDMKAASKPAGTPARPPFGSTEDAGEQSGEKGGEDAAQATAIKAWYVKRFGEPDKGAEQIAKELYGQDFKSVTYYKTADFRRFLRSGMYDPKLGSMLLLSPDQIMDIVADGIPVSEIRATMVESRDTLGGYLVPEDFRLDLIERLPGLTTVRPLASVSRTSRDMVSRLKSKGGNNRYPNGVRVEWVDELPSALNTQNTSYGRINIPIHTVMAVAEPSRNDVEDSQFDLVGHLQDSLSIASALDEDEKFLTGKGIGSPQGIFATNADGTLMNSDIVVVNSGNGSALTPTSLIDVTWMLDAQYRRSPSLRWVFNKSTASAISKMREDGATGPFLWTERNTQLGQQTTQLRGYAFSENEVMPDVAANAYPVGFGDLKAYEIVDRIGMSIERYLDSPLASRNVIQFIMRRRLGAFLNEGYRMAAVKVSV
jgi:HK97 family phage major capsid protein